MPKIVRAKKTDVKGKSTESEIKLAVREWLASQPDIYIANNPQTFGMYPDGTKFRAGIGVGSADLIGSITIGGEWPIAIFLGIEIKKPGERLRPEQEIWHEQMRRRGAVVGVATSVADAADIVREARGLSVLRASFQ